MELDRQSIEKRDFPIGRRGYEPEAVDAHLAAIAREVDELRRGAGANAGESVAAVASAQVQAIVQAAETAAADIQGQAEAEAEGIRNDAESEAARTRDAAVAQSREHIAKVSEAAASVLQRIEAMQSELGALLESLRTGANRLHADLSLLEGNVDDLYGAAGGPRGGAARPAPAPPAPLAAPAGPDPFERAGARTPPPGVPLEPAMPGATPEPPPPPPPEPGPEPEVEVAGHAEDAEGARLVALNMALNGTSREETDRYLAENYELEDRRSLLDEVYAAVEG